MEKRDNKGFTLIEMLIVIAIIAVLVAIAIPVFRGEINRANIETDNANLRNAEASAMAMFMSGERVTERGATTWFDQKFYGYFFDLEAGKCVCDKDAQSVGYLNDKGYGKTPQLSKKTGGSSSDHRGQLIYVAISTDGSTMKAGWTKSKVNYLYVEVLDGTFMNPDDYYLF